MLKQLYRDLQRQDLSELIEALTISDLQKHFLRSRWLDQVLWMEDQAQKACSRYYILRLIAIVGGVIIPALVSLNIFATVTPAVKWSALGLSLLVAISVAIEEFFHFGERWHHYQHTVKCLKIEGWQFFQLSGLYQSCQDHAEAYHIFAGRVEAIIQRDVEVYITEIVHERKEEKERLKIPMNTNNRTDRLEVASQNRVGS